MFAFKWPSECRPIYYRIQFQRIVRQSGEEGDGCATSKFGGVAKNAGVLCIWRQQFAEDDASDFQIICLRGEQGLQSLVNRADAIRRNNDEWNAEVTGEIGDILSFPQRRKESAGTFHNDNVAAFPPKIDPHSQQFLVELSSLRLRSQMRSKGRSKKLRANAA